MKDLTNEEFVEEYSEDLQKAYEEDLVKEMRANAAAEYEEWLREQENPDF